MQEVAGGVGGLNPRFRRFHPSQGPAAIAALPPVKLRQNQNGCRHRLIRLHIAQSNL